MKPALTYELARAAGKDAADRNARHAGRIVWNTEDYDIACDETNRLLDCIEGK